LPPDNSSQINAFNSKIVAIGEMIVALDNTNAAANVEIMGI
jgi:hypothetical protein